MRSELELPSGSMFHYTDDESVNYVGNALVNKMR